MNKAFEKILERFEELQNNLLQQTEGDINLQVGVINGVMYSRKIVQEVAEEYNNGWIPCSERLPEKEGKYLVTLYKWNIVSFADFKNLKYNPHFNAPVIAWQPLPEPYKEGE